MFDEVQLKKWHQILSQSNNDLVWRTEIKEKSEHRKKVAKAVVNLLQKYLDNKMSTMEFREVFDRTTRTTWNEFGLKGLSGGMFLNMLVKYLDEDWVKKELQSVLPVPNNKSEAYDQINNFYQFLEGTIAANFVTRRQIQTGRVPFFVSVWWHLQNVEEWPVYYPSVQRAFDTTGISTNDYDNVIERYFAYKDTFIQLANKLNVSSWDLEYAILWYDQADNDLIEQPTEVNQAPLFEEELPKRLQDMAQEKLSHEYIQYEIARIGKELNYDVWIARNDHNRTWKNFRLGDLSLDKLPPMPGVNQDVIDTISYIDVLWLDGRKIIAAFEVEHTTSIYSGILRMSDLLVSVANVTFPLYIVINRKRLNKAIRELKRPTFQQIDLPEHCLILFDEDVIMKAEHIIFAGDATVLKHRLAKKVNDYLD